MQQLLQNERTGGPRRNQSGTSGARESRSSTTPPLPHHGRVFFFGVLLPIIAVLFETTFHFCARHFFDPFPTTNHVILFLLIPFSNYLTLLASRRNLSAHYSFMTLASGMALGMGAMYSLMFLPLMASSLFFVGALGFGLLGLAPALSLPCTWLAGKRICKLSSQSRTYFNPHQLEHIGHLIILVMVLAVELPSTLTRVYLGMAAEPATEARGIGLLRKYGNEEVMLRACYERSGRATDIIGSLYESGHPLPVDSARKIFYKVTGKPFNSVPIPAGARATIQHALAYDPGGLNAKVEDEFDLDTDIAGETVSGFARGLSVAGSNVTGKLDANAMLAELDWTIGFANVSKYDREARCKILLPAGAVVSHAILTINGKEHEATIMVREAARAYYQQAVMQHKDDPLLVSTSGADQVLVQCYPVHPGSDMKVKLHIVAPLAFDKNGEATLALPSFAEKNFQVKAATSLAIEAAGALTISGAREQIAAKEVSSSGKTSWQLTGNLAASVAAGSTPVIHGRRNKDCQAVFCHDIFQHDPVLLERKISEQRYKLPEFLAIYVDGSAGMKDAMGEIADGLSQLPPSITASIFLCADADKILCRNSKPGSKEFQHAISALRQFAPAGGQDNSLLLVDLCQAAARQGGAVLWIHASQPVSAAAGLKNAVSQRLPGAAGVGSPVLCDLQVAAGPVETLNNVDGCSAFKRLDKTGSLSDDLRQLYHSWQPQPASEAQPASETAEFIIHTPLNFNASASVPETSPALAQLFAYRRILADLERPQLASPAEPNQLAAQYHLITPISSAVVTDTEAQLTPLQKPQPNPLAEFFSPSTIENAYQGLSQGLNDTLLGAARGLSAMLNGLNPANSLNSAVNKSFSNIEGQLNRLNAVTTNGPGGNRGGYLEESNSQTGSASAPMLQGATNGTIGPAGAGGDAFDSSGATGAQTNSYRGLHAGNQQEEANPIAQSDQNNYGVGLGSERVMDRSQRISSDKAGGGGGGQGGGTQFFVGQTAVSRGSGGGYAAGKHGWSYQGAKRYARERSSVAPQSVPADELGAYNQPEQKQLALQDMKKGAENQLNERSARKAESYKQDLSSQADKYNYDAGRGFELKSKKIAAPMPYAASISAKPGPYPLARPMAHPPTPIEVQGLATNDQDRGLSAASRGSYGKESQISDGRQTTASQLNRLSVTQGSCQVEDAETDPKRASSFFVKVAAIIFLMVAGAITFLIHKRTKRIFRTLAISSGIFLGLPAGIYFLCCFIPNLWSQMCGAAPASSDLWLWVADTLVGVALLVVVLRSRKSHHREPLSRTPH
jgi:hypothetical protein